MCFFPWCYPQIYIWDICVLAKSCPTLCDPMDYSLPGSPVHGIFQARVLEWVAISSSRGSPWPNRCIYRGVYPYLSYGFFYYCFSSWCILYSLLLREKYNHEGLLSIKDLIYALSWGRLFRTGCILCDASSPQPMPLREEGLILITWILINEYYLIW